jgi:hypothetical protein
LGGFGAYTNASLKAHIWRRFHIFIAFLPSV